jgi:L-alanine-DL-glutamate epimerase-like enolase superfamily enzyme
VKIDDVSVTIFGWENIPVTIYHQGATAATGSNLGLLRIHTDAGLEGYAFLGSASNPAAMDGPQLIRSLKPMLMGQDPLQRERLHAGMRLINRAVSYRTIGAVDTALWDLAGKIAGLPVHALMGTFRNSIPAYASSQVLPDAAAYVDQAQAFKAAGWQAYKIHPPRVPERDIKVCEAVRKAVGDDYRLMLDSTWSYEYTDALRVGRAIEEMGYYWFEDPLSDEDIYGYVKLRGQEAVPPGARQSFSHLSAMPERQVLSGESGPSRRPPQTGEAAQVVELLATDRGPAVTTRTERSVPFRLALSRHPRRRTVRSQRSTTRKNQLYSQHPPLSLKWRWV